MRSCSIGELCLCVGGFLDFGRVRAGGLDFSAGGGLRLGGTAGAGGGGVNPQLDSKISSLAKPTHPNSPSEAQHGVFAAQVSVRRRDCSYSRKLDKIEHPRCGLRSGSRYGADRAVRNSAVPVGSGCKPQRRPPGSLPRP